MALRRWHRVLRLASAGRAQGHSDVPASASFSTMLSSGCTTTMPSAFTAGAADPGKPDITTLMRLPNGRASHEHRAMNHEYEYEDVGWPRSSEQPNTQPGTKPIPSLPCVAYLPTTMLSPSGHGRHAYNLMRSQASVLQATGKAALLRCTVLFAGLVAGKHMLSSSGCRPLWTFQSTSFVRSTGASAPWFNNTAWPEQCRNCSGIMSSAPCIMHAI